MSQLRDKGPRVLLLDMDGTLFDSEPAHERAWTRALESIGLQPGEWAARFPGVSDHRIAENAVREFRLHGITPEHLHAIKNGIYHEREAQTVRLFPGVAERLDRVGSLELTRGLVTSGSPEDARILLTSNGIDDQWFHSIVTAADVRAQKPNPEPYIQAIQRLNAVPQDCVAVEDSESGYRAARAAGIRTIVCGADSPPAWIEPRGEWFATPAAAIDHAIAVLTGCPDAAVRPRGPGTFDRI